MTETRVCNRCKHDRPKTEFLSRRTFCSRCHNLYQRYKINYAEFLDLLESQNRQCGICSRDLDIETDIRHRQCVIDHCHGTKVVRGILCHNCNLMLGYAKDRAVVLQEAILYLDKTRSDISTGADTNEADQDAEEDRQCHG